MRRRQVLALAAVGLSGCLSDSSPGDATENGTTTTEATATVTPVSDRTTTAAESTTETPPLPNVEAYPGDCPSYGEFVTTVVCSDAAPDDVPLAMTASESAVELDATVEFTLHNDTETRFDTNHYGALLHKQVDGEWFRIGPILVNDLLTPLSTGASHTWSVELEHTPDSEARGHGPDERRYAGLGGGRYAFGSDGWFEGGTYEEKTAAVATVEVQAPPAELTTTDDVTDVSVDGETLTARWTGTNVPYDETKATYVLERTDATPDRRLITEQVLQTEYNSHYGKPFQDALALSVEHDVERVELTGQPSGRPPFRARGQVVGYEGQAYRITATTTEERE